MTNVNLLFPNFSVAKYMKLKMSDQLLQISDFTACHLSVKLINYGLMCAIFQLSIYHGEEIKK
jgi:hypothetical protein